MTDAAADWRGIAKEDETVTATGNLVLAGRSRRLLFSLLRPYRKLAAGALALVVLDNAAKLSMPLWIAYGLDQGISGGRQGNWTPLLTAVIGFIAVTLLGGLTTYSFLRASGTLSQRVLFDLRVRAFTHTQELSVSFHENYTAGKVVTRLTTDIDALQELLEGALNQAMSALLSVFTIAIILIWLDPTLAMIVLAGFVPLLIATRWAQRRQRAGYRRTRGAIARVIVGFVEAMSGMRAVQAFGREERNLEVVGVDDRQYQQANMTAIRGMADYVGISIVLQYLTTVLVLFVGAWSVIEGDLAIGVLAAYLLYLDQFYGPLDELAQVFNAYQSAAAALEKISGVLEEKPAVPEPSDAVPLGNSRGSIELAGVSFGYHADRPVLPTLDLVVPAGQVVALVGATGAGKSTLAKLITRFYDPSAGAVRLDGIDLRELANVDLRRAIVMVTQEAYLFSGTIADNIRLGRPDASDAEVRAAAEAVGLASFVESLPDGYRTDVRTRGGRLSAGQRQLVGFARVFLADPSVIVLDEATSSLDIPGERLVQRALETLLRDRTAVIIAHRLSTVAIADRVLVMEGGRVVEDGSPAELVTGDGRFAGLHAAWRESLV
ncbi:ABC transporter ATP-binding protein [Nocardia camponoti]|uniref:ABC transporter ATP-binding protein n=1 Tax=Nocardia camponoti TaxID=1616106 RepID=A0A917QV24_9NOCA|nr:ABC transporter ATP-binding protein [Nocardia camponoti]GGK69530.1 ABC transporter ATP-binding protein [Nocardia camponoti]